MNEGKIRNHMCEGLKRFQEYSTFSCIPKYNEDGSISGCDDTNYIRITHCPFCGEYLGKVEYKKYTCNDCGYTWIDYHNYDESCSKCWSYNRTLEIISE